MVDSVYPKSLSPQQICLLHHALRVLFKIDQAPWSDIPLEVRFSLAKYMGEDVWTHLPDLLALREAALLIVRDAIARTGEFGEEGVDTSAGDAVPVTRPGARMAR